MSACESAYYSAAEKVGYHKREILTDRVEAARDAQTDAEEQFQSAQEQLLTLPEKYPALVHIPRYASIRIIPTNCLGT